MSTLLFFNNSGLVLLWGGVLVGYGYWAFVLGRDKGRPAEWHLLGAFALVALIVVSNTAEQLVGVLGLPYAIRQGLLWLSGFWALHALCKLTRTDTWSLCRTAWRYVPGLSQIRRIFLRS